MTRPVLYLLGFGLIWLARTYADITPIADLGIVRIPLTTALLALLPLAILAVILRRMCRDTPASSTPAPKRTFAHIPEAKR